MLKKDKLEDCIEITEDKVINLGNGLGLYSDNLKGFNFGEHYFNEAWINYISSNGDTALIKANRIFVSKEIFLKLNADLLLVSKEDIIFKEGAKLFNEGKGNLYLLAGFGNTKGKVIFEDNTQKQIISSGAGKVYINYNPELIEFDHKYHNPYPYNKHVASQAGFTAYMLVNTLQDLQDINKFLHGNYALSQSIDASETRNWNNGKGFEPLSIKDKHIPFSGNFDGNGGSIKGLYINRPDEKDVGLFGSVAGQKKKYAEISNLVLENTFIKGDHYVGSLAGDAEFVKFSNITVHYAEIVGRDVVGGIIGTGTDVILSLVSIDKEVDPFIHATEYKGLLAGSLENAVIYYPEYLGNQCLVENCVGYEELVTYEVKEC